MVFGLGFLSSGLRFGELLGRRLVVVGAVDVLLGMLHGGEVEDVLFTSRLVLVDD